MKKLLVVALSLFALTSCDKTKSMADEAIKENMKSSESYKALEYGQLDSCYSEYEDMHYNYVNEFDLYKSQFKIDIINNTELAHQDLDSMKKYAALDSVSRADFKPKFIGWQMRVKYSGTNAYGATVDDSTIVYFNQDKTHCGQNKLYFVKHADDK